MKKIHLLIKKLEDNAVMINKMAVKHKWELFSFVIAFIIFCYIWLYKKSNALPFLDMKLDTTRLDTEEVNLDLDNALAFKSKDNIFGYIYFTKTYNNRAEYILRLFKRSNSTPIKVMEIANTDGNVRFENHLMSIRYEKIAMLWFPKAYLNLLSGIHYAAVVPLDNLHRINKGELEQIHWTTLEERPSM